MPEAVASIRKTVRTPRAAAWAGIVFSVLLLSSQILIRTSIPVSPLGSENQVTSHLRTISIAMNLLPFAGIAFLWFIGVIRDRLAEREDRFFATIFLGSGLLYPRDGFYFGGASIRVDPDTGARIGNPT